MENPECMEWLEDERKRLEEEGVREVPPEAVPIGLNQLCTGMQDSANGGCHGDSGRFPISGIRSSIKAHKRQLGTKRHLILKSKLINTPSLMVILPGGPLTVEEVSYVLAGVVSGGGKVCGKPRVPSIYTRVARYADWLKVGEMSFARLTCNPSDGDTTEMSAVVDLEGIVSCELVFQNIFQIFLPECVSIMLLQTILDQGLEI